MRHFLAGIGFWLLIATQPPSADNGSDALAINLADVEWGPPGGGDGVPLGTRTALQRIDPETRGVTYYAMFPAGTHFDQHWHTHDEFVSIMSGEVTLQLGNQTYHLSPGAYVVIPGGMNHSWDVPDADAVVILVSRAGPADFNYVD